MDLAYNDPRSMRRLKADVEPLLDEVADLRRRLAEAEQRWTGFTGRIGYGDNITEPAAPPEHLVDVWEEISAAAHDHIECPQWCDECDQWEQQRSCTACHGSGYGGPLRQSMENVQGWTECEHCAGEGRAHVEYTLTGTSAASTRADELAAALAVQTTRIEAVEKLLASWQDEALYGHIEDRPVSAMRAELLAAALSAAADTDKEER